MSIAFDALSAEQATNSETKKQPKPLSEGSAWTLSWPLGTHIESTIDTVLYNYQRQFVTALTSDSWASTGQFTGPGINMIYFKRPQQLPFFFDNALEHYIPTFQKQKFYNVYIPFTQLSYNNGYGTESRTDHLTATFAGNVNRRIGIGAHVDYPYTKGSYNNQAAKGLTYGISGYYTGDRYEMQAFYNHFNHVNKENGGITDDLYIIDPAQLQGGINSIEAKSIPTNLSNAHNRVIGNELYMSHSYKIGYWKDITQPEDTVEHQIFVPSIKLTYSFDWQKDSHLFINQNMQDASKFWEHTYFNNKETQDHSHYWQIDNTLGVEMIEGFNPKVKFGISAYATYQINKYRYDVEGMYERPVDSLDENGNNTTGYSILPEGWAKSLGETRNRLWLGGRLQKSRGSIVTYSADAKFGLAGDVVVDIDVTGSIETHFHFGNDSINQMQIKADAMFQNTEPNYFYNHYVGNHYIWNNNFGKIRKAGVQGHLHIPWTKTDLHVGFENIQNQVYFNESCLPSQYSGHIQIFSASIEQKLKFGIWNWNNRVTYQATSDKIVMPLPSFAVYSNMFLYFKAFKALTMQIGVDANYYTKYKGYAYQPATMSFHSQGENGISTGGFLFSDVYITARLYQVRLFLMVSHLNQDWFSRDYFALPHYPVDPLQFRFGLSIDFAN